MKQKLFFLIFFYAVLSFSQGKYTVNGVVTDVSNGETLLGATVFLKGTSIGVNTNEYGYYSITVPKGVYKIEFSYLGYKSKELDLNLFKNKELNIELEESSDQLDEVVVNTSENKSINVRTPQMSVSKLSSSTIKKVPVVLGEVDVIKTLQLLPGVTNAGEGASGFNVRGGAEDQNLVLLDEAVIYNSSHLFGFFSVFNNDAIKDIKLYKGGIPSRFGGRASSVLDIRQKDGNKKQFKFSGGLGLISSRLAIEGPTFKDRGSFFFAGRTTYVNVFLAAANNKNRAGFYDFNFKTDYKVNNSNKLYFSAYKGDDKVEFSEIFINSFGNVSFNLRWNHIFNDRLFSNLSLIYSKYDYNLEIDLAGFNWNSDIKNYNLKYDFGYYLNEKSKFNFGLNGIYYQFNPGELLPSSKESNINYEKLDNKFALETALYSGFEHKWNDKLTTEVGFRLSHFNRIGKQILNKYNNDLPIIYNVTSKVYERSNPIGSYLYNEGESIATFFNFEPRFGISYRLNDDSSIKGSYNRMVQYIHLISNTNSASPLDIWAPSGRFIKPQKADQYALGYFKNFKENKYSLEIESYFKTVDNRLDYIDGADLIANNTIETEILPGESRSYGLELLFRKNKGNFTGWLSYTLAKAEQLTTITKIGGKGLNNGNWYNAPYDRTHDFSLTCSYKINDIWSLSSNFIFQTGRPVTYPNGQFEYNGITIPTYSQRNADRLTPYHRVDLSITLSPEKYKHRNFKGEWVFGVYNMYNRKNAASINFEQNQETGANEAVRTAIFGIVPSVTFNFKF